MPTNEWIAPRVAAEQPQGGRSWTRQLDRVAPTPFVAAGGGNAAGLLRLQRSAGNAAVAYLLSVQRCGSIPSDVCPCHAGDGEQSEDTSNAAQV